MRHSWHLQGGACEIVPILPLAVLLGDHGLLRKLVSRRAYNVGDTGSQSGATALHYAALLWGVGAAEILIREGGANPTLLADLGVFLKDAQFASGRAATILAFAAAPLNGLSGGSLDDLGRVQAHLRDAMQSRK